MFAGDPGYTYASLPTLSEPAAGESAKPSLPIPKNPFQHLLWSFFELKVKSRKLFSQKSSIVDVRLGFKYASALM